MSTFWIVYWIAFAAIVFFGAFTAVFFEFYDWRERKPISLAYVLLAIFVGAIPGLNVLGGAILIIAIIGGAISGDLVPKSILLRILSNTEEKFTYHHICSLVAQGRFDEIPSGYNIKWIGGVEPHNVYDFETDGKSIIFTRGDFAIPDKIRIRGEYVVFVPSPSFDDEPIDYGDVFIKTDFLLNDIKFIYTEEFSKIKLRPCIALNFGYYENRLVKKSEVTFNFEVCIENVKFEVFNGMMGQFVDEGEKSVAYINYDYFIVKF